MSYDAALWGALACALTALGLVGSYLAWQRRGAIAALRGVAWSLLPVAAWLTGTLRLVANLLGDIGDWAVRLVFSPTMWLGICLAGVAVVLFGVSGVLRRRNPRRTGDRSHSAAGKPQESHALDPGGGAGRRRGRRNDDLGLDDADDIEAILRKHGIS